MRSDGFAVGLEQAADLVRGAERIVVLTGAGVSAESGVPTFRGESGLWKSYRPEQLATPEAFAADARLVWEWYGMRREMVSRCTPNPGHGAIARASLDHRSFRVITQNVDGLHALALESELRGRGELGPDVPPRLPLRLHGSLFRIRCTACEYSREDRAPIDSTDMGTLPRCPDCGALLRPGVVWFGEALDADVLSAAFDWASEADVCVVAGTSAVVHPAASIPLATSRAGGTIIEVNPEETPLTPAAAVSLRGTAGEILPEILE